MKTTLLLAALLSVGVFLQNKIQQVNFDFDFFQNENFVSPSSSSNVELYQHQKLKLKLTKENISKQSFSFISRFLKSTILPIGTIVFMMWIIFGLGIFRSVKNIK